MAKYISEGFCISCHNLIPGIVKTAMKPNFNLHVRTAGHCGAFTVY